MVKPKRTSKPADIWDKFVGAIRPTRPLTHLPTNKVVLKRYYGIRNANLQAAGKSDTKGAAVKDTWGEIKRVWDAACVPTINISRGNGTRKLQILVNWFYTISFNKRYLKFDDSDAKVIAVKSKLNELFDKRLKWNLV